MIAERLHRTDLTAQIPGFVSLAEAFLFRELAIQSLELAVLVTPVNGVITLPADCASVGRVTTAYYGVDATLDYGNAPRRWGTGGAPLSYTLEAGGLRLNVSAPGYACTLYYTPKLTPLSDANPTNWLLVNAPDLYLAASQLEGARFTQNAEQAAGLTASLPGMLDSVQRLTRRTGQPQHGGMQIKPRRLTPWR